MDSGPRTYPLRNQGILFPVLHTIAFFGTDFGTDMTYSLTRTPGTRYQQCWDQNVQNLDSIPYPTHPTRNSAHLIPDLALTNAEAGANLTHNTCGIFTTPLLGVGTLLGNLGQLSTAGPDLEAGFPSASNCYIP